MSTATHQTVVELAPRQRSRVTNGHALLEGVNGTSAGARRFKDLIANLTADLGGELSEVERQQVRVTAGAILHSEQLTASVVRGEAVSSEEATRAANVASRLLAGLKRGQRAKPSANTLATYLANRGAA